METVCPPAVNPALPALGGRVAKPPTKRGFSSALLVFAVAAGAILKLFGPAWVQSVFASLSLDNAGGASALLSALIAAVMLHEGGHLFAALLLDFDVLGICVGPLRAARSHGRWRLQVSGRVFAASVSAIPRGVTCWRERVMLVVAAGPTATLVTGYAAGWLLLHAPVSGWAGTFLAALTQLSAFLFILGLVPNARSARVRNDARLFSILWEDSAEAREIFLYHLVTQVELAGLRPREYPFGLIRAMAAMDGRVDSMLVFAHVIASWALDRGDVASAHAWDARALELSRDCSLTAMQASFARSACLDVISRNDFPAARRKFAEVELDSLSPSWFRHRAMAAYWLVEGNIPDALAEVCRARHAFPQRAPYFEFERMLLTELHQKTLALEQCRQETPMHGSAIAAAGA
ncbi:MAG: M50 family metallopeptidase [Acidobacteriaceae bacterium]|nr:M50 family metallopeptidase [Acidobacteriaceae bacterium]